MRKAARTGISFVATQAADVIGPTLIGLLIDLGGRNYRMLFLSVVIALAATTLLINMVRRGEVRAAA